MGVTIPSGLAKWLWPLAVGNILANIGIVVTGAAVRLTGSGLGCPTWPQCTEESYRPHGELGWHGAIEFGNRLLTFVLAAVAIACFLAALASRDRIAIRLSFLIGLYIPIQAVIGGITVLTDLNPWVVSLHFLSSMVIIMFCLALLDHLRSPTRAEAPAASRLVAMVVFVSGWAVLYLGTVVTGAGPHAGDEDARRNGLDPEVASLLHAGSVAVLVVATVVLLVLAVRAGDRWLTVVTSALLALELAQGAVGWVQYLNELPVLLVAVHMLGAGLIAAGMARVLFAVRAHESHAQHTGRLLAWAAGLSRRT
ncbi:COX15/CtaA family protein [Nocardioides sp. AE5]|uniref:COX15/CtaA family protein n=1 Tax=Nocardioides sp. AE5 TaxID=2962573 RepID=UPI0028822374|nr:COX15/CtaA family protein [Nocardioides sp. AE5]MDT0203634.1 COX15/CtaA family protein [Nocardioides sp. AE5]